MSEQLRTTLEDPAAAFAVELDQRIAAEAAEELARKEAEVAAELARQEAEAARQEAEAAAERARQEAEAARQQAEAEAKQAELKKSWIDPDADIYKDDTAGLATAISQFRAINNRLGVERTPDVDDHYTTSLHQQETLEGRYDGVGFIGLAKAKAELLDAGADRTTLNDLDELIIKPRLAKEAQSMVDKGEADQLIWVTGNDDSGQHRIGLDGREAWTMGEDDRRADIRDLSREDLLAWRFDNAVNRFRKEKDAAKQPDMDEPDYVTKVQETTDQPKRRKNILQRFRDRKTAKAAKATASETSAEEQSTTVGATSAEQEPQANHPDSKEPGKETQEPGKVDAKVDAAAKATENRSDRRKADDYKDLGKTATKWMRRLDWAVGATQPQLDKGFAKDDRKAAAKVARQERRQAEKANRQADKASSRASFQEFLKSGYESTLSPQEQHERQKLGEAALHNDDDLVDAKS
jgi:hypothetical protein